MDFNQYDYWKQWITRGEREHRRCFRSENWYLEVCDGVVPRAAVYPLFVAIMRFLPLLSFTAYITSGGACMPPQRVFK